MIHRDFIFLSERLKMSAEMVTRGYSVADVGCDHAHTSIWLVKEDIAPFAIAMDVRKGPLSHADANIRLYGLEDRITTRLSDGLDALQPGETDAVIIAGMGGTLTVQILSKGNHKAAAAKELILQPQSDIGMVRRHLRENGFEIIAEKMCRESGKFYNSFKAVFRNGTNACAPGERHRGNETDQEGLNREIFDEFGEILLRSKDSILYDYLKILYGKNERILTEISDNGSETSSEKKKFFLHEKQLIENALQFYK